MTPDSMILQAAKMCREAHKGQVRKGSGAPYEIHPARIAGQMMLREDATPESVAACFLHDTVEDTEVTLDEIRDVFGETVATLVSELTNQFTKEAYPKFNRAARHKMEIDRIKSISKEAKVIKLLDRIDNLIDHPKEDGFLSVYLKESKSLLEAVKEADDFLAQKLENLIQSLSR